MERNISELLRRRIVADLHLGLLKPGGRLPSLRAVAREMDVSIRAAARAYGELEQEGLVTVRGRSGIYLVLPQSAPIELAEPFDWYAEMLRQAWSRRLTVNDVNAVLRQLVETPLKVACVESSDDHMEAFCAELEADFALQTTSVKLVREGVEVAGEALSFFDALRPADFVVTTAFHATEVSTTADLLKKPVVAVSVSETLVRALEQQLRSGSVTIVAADPVFVERFRTHLLDHFRASGDLRVVLMEDVDRDPGLIAGTTPLYTRAARRRMKEEEYHLLPPPIPFLSGMAARKIVQCMLSTFSKRFPLAA